MFLLRKHAIHKLGIVSEYVKNIMSLYYCTSGRPMMTPNEVSNSATTIEDKISDKNIVMIRILVSKLFNIFKCY